jgi:hypothetical protein
MLPLPLLIGLSGLLLVVTLYFTLVRKRDTQGESAPKQL